MIRPRSDWTSTGTHCSASFDPRLVKGVAIHWNGPAVRLDPAAQLRADRNYHISAKGWCDIAYNLAVDQAGDVWVCRGLDLKSSANGSTTANITHVAIVALIGEGQTPTPAMYQGFRDAVALVRAKYPSATQIATHNDVRPSPTACPGPDLTAAVRNGTLEPTTGGGDLDMDRNTARGLVRITMRSFGIRGLSDVPELEWHTDTLLGNERGLDGYIDWLEDQPEMLARLREERGQHGLT